MLTFVSKVNRMFLENPIDSTTSRGRIEVICGSMFSGKTEELIRKLKRAQFAQQKAMIFRSSVDLRYEEDAYEPLCRNCFFTK